MPSSTASSDLLTALHNKATALRIESVRSTSEAGSGHPSSCCSAADIVAALFFSVMRYDPANPKAPNSDRFVLSKGHAAPLLYAAWAEAGLFPKSELLKLRTLSSDLEGHPTPRLPFVDMATGSLGQGLPVGVGLALNAKLDRSDYRTYVLMGDGESVEGSVWEAVEVAQYQKLDNLCAIVDVNRLGQSDPTMLQHDMEAYRSRWSGFGWHALVVDGHDLSALLTAFDEAGRTKGRPTVLLAKTYKGRGVSFIENHPNWHGKPLGKGEETQKAIAELTQQFKPNGVAPQIHKPQGSVPAHATDVGSLPPPPYKPGDSAATREAFGVALEALGGVNPAVVALDADVKNSTYTEKFGKKYPDRFFENFIAEQNMLGAAAGLAACGKIPFVATFAAFFTRAYDFIRMAAISQSNVKLVGTHVGVSIGEDGPSQMGLEDIAMMGAQPGMVVLYPSDATSTYRLVETAARHKGMVYIRAGRPKSPVLYGPDERFHIGGSKVVRQSPGDVLTIVAAGVTLFEALKAHEQLKGAGIAVRVVDLYSIAPIDRATLMDCARATQGRILTVEDHYAHGGLGDAVLSAVSTEGIKVHKLAVRAIPHSGKPDELIDHYGIGARSIVETAKQVIK